MTNKQRNANKLHLITKAAEALAAACEINGLPVSAILPMVKHLATKITKHKNK